MINAIAFTVFGKDIYWYGIIMAFSVLLGIYLAMREAKRLGINPEYIIDFGLLAIPLAIIGARVYYVIFSLHAFADNWLRIFYIWEGGIAIYGSLIGGTVAAIIFCKWRNIKFLKLADIVAPSLIIGQCLGRWGNFFNQEAYGYEISNRLWKWFPAGVFIEYDQKWHMATFFYESIWDLFVFIVLIYHRKKARFDGEIFIIYLVFYSLGRIFVEGLRTDSLMLGSIRVSQLLGIILVIGAGTYFIWKRKKLALISSNQKGSSEQDSEKQN